MQYEYHSRFRQDKEKARKENRKEWFDSLIGGLITLTVIVLVSIMLMSL